MMEGSGRTVHVGALAYDGCFGSEVFALTDLLRLGSHAASHLRGDEATRFAVSIVGAGNGVVRTAGGGRLSVDRGGTDVDLLVVPGFDLMPVDGLEHRLASVRDEVAMIRREAHRIPIAAICVGAYLLGEARLLDGRRATTAWLFADHLARRYPSAFVDSSAMIVEDSGITTTAAFSASADLAMSLINDNAGPDVARLTARITLTGDQRTSQTPYVDPDLLRTSAPSFVAEVRSWFASHIDEPYDLAHVAAAFHVSPRTFLRRFQEQSDASPLQHLQQMRVDRAKQLLETTGQPLRDIAANVGYADPATFRRLFRSHTTMPPSAYRQRFGSSEG